MSFEIRVAPWCEDCEEFELESCTSTIDINNIEERDKKLVRTIIYCRHESRCKSIYEKARVFVRQEGKE